MFSGLQEDQAEGRAGGHAVRDRHEPVGTIALADMLEVEPAEVGKRAAANLRAQLEEENRDIQLREAGRRLEAGDAPGLPRVIGALNRCLWDTRKLSQAAMGRRWPSLRVARCR